MFRDAWKIFCRIGLVVGILLSFFALIELFRVYVFFHRMGPYWGWGFVGLCTTVAVGLFVYIRVVLRAYPTVLTPPVMPALADADRKELQFYIYYLVRYLERLADNPNLETEWADRACARARFMANMLEVRTPPDELRRGIQETECDVVEPILDQLADVARKEVRRSVRDVMLGVSLSPYHSVDLVIVLYRNAAMVMRIVATYASRPNSREQLLILRDVMRVVVTVNFLYIGRHLIENLFSNVPLIGRVVDDIGQGLGAGLFTSAAGHAAVERCAAFRGWDKGQAANSLAAQTRTFLIDVRNIFTKDVLPDLRGRIRAELPEDKTDDPGFWETINNGINAAVDATAGAISTLVVKPAVVGTRGVMRAGTAVTKTVGRVAAAATPSAGRRRRRKRRQRPPRRLGTIGQRIKYAFRRPS